MYSMSTCRNGGNFGLCIEEISRLRTGFTALHIEYKKGVLKTAQWLLKIQKMHTKMAAGSGVK